MRKHNHAGKNKFERQSYEREVGKVETDATLPIEQIFGTSSIDEDKEYLKPAEGRVKPRRRSKRNRIKIHFKEHWIDYLFGAVLSICAFFVVESRIKFAEINKDINYTKESIAEIKDELKEISTSTSVLSTKIQSLTDQFTLFVNINLKKEP